MHKKTTKDNRAKNEAQTEVLIAEIYDFNDQYDKKIRVLQDVLNRLKQDKEVAQEKHKNQGKIRSYEAQDANIRDAMHNLQKTMAAHKKQQIKYEKAIHELNDLRESNGLDRIPLKMIHPTVPALDQKHKHSAWTTPKLSAEENKLEPAVLIDLWSKYEKFLVEAQRVDEIILHNQKAVAREQETVDRLMDKSLLFRALTIAIPDSGPGLIETQAIQENKEALEKISAIKQEINTLRKTHNLPELTTDKIIELGNKYSATQWKPRNDIQKILNNIPKPESPGPEKPRKNM